MATAQHTDDVIAELQQRVGDRFEIVGPLGMGGMGAVYEAYDKTRDERVALKTLRTFDADALYRFKNEFRALVDLAHPNLVTLYELFARDAGWFFTMELVRGVGLLEWVRGGMAPTPTSNGPSGDMSLTRRRSEAPKAPESPTLTQPQNGDSRIAAQAMRAMRAHDGPRLRSTFGQLARGIAALHAANRVHRDVKPSNVMVTESGRVVVLDFGIIAELGSGEPTRDLMGTPSYMAPEQILGGDITPASDWYSFGTVLFETLAGRKPYLGGESEILRAKLEVTPPSLRTLAPEVPEDLVSLCAELLSRDPYERPSAEDIRQRLDARASSSRPPSAMATPDFVGRSEQLAELRAAFERARAGEGQSCLVHASSGMGKTALVERFLGELYGAADVLVLRARCYERESVPYKALDALVDALCRVLESSPASRVRKKAWPEDGAALIEAFPVIARVAPRTKASSTTADKRRALRALTQLLLATASGRVLVLFVDDLQWGDVDSAPLFAELEGSAEAPVMFLGTYRSEHASAPFLSALRAGARRAPKEIALEPLSTEAVRDLAAEILWNLPNRRTLAAKIATECAGSPYFALELARYAALHGTDAAKTSLHDVIRAREARLSEEARTLLETVVIAGRPIQRTVVDRATANLQARGKALNELIVGSFVKSAAQSADERLETTHDAIREAVAAEIPDDRQRAVHLAIADALDSSDIHDRARHLFFAWPDADNERVFEACREAGKAAAEAYAYEQSFVHLERARKVAEGSGIELGVDFEQIFGEAAARTGRVDTAVPAFRRALSLTNPRDRLARAQLRCELGRIRNGQMFTTAAVEEIEKGLREIGTSAPSRSPLQLLVTLWSIAVATWFYKRQHVTTDPERLRYLRTRSLLYLHYSVACHFQMDAIGRMQTLLRCFRVAAEIGPSRELVQCFGVAIAVFSTIGNRRMADSTERRGTEIARALADPVAIASVSQYSGHMSNFFGDVVTAEKKLGSCLTDYGWALENSDYLTATADLAGNLLMRGKAHEALRWIEAGLKRTSIEGGDASGLSQGHTYRCYIATSLALIGRVDEGREHLVAFGAQLDPNSGDRWRRAQYTAHKALFAAEVGEIGASFDVLVDAFEAIRIRNVPLQLRHFYVAKAAVRLAQIDGSAESIVRFEAAREELVKLAESHASLRSRLRIIEAGYFAKIGDETRAATARNEAHSLAMEIDSPLVLYEVAVLRADAHERAGKEALARAELGRAKVIATARGWLPRLEKLETRLRE